MECAKTVSIPVWTENNMSLKERAKSIVKQHYSEQMGDIDLTIVIEAAFQQVDKEGYMRGMKEGIELIDKSGRLKFLEKSIAVLKKIGFTNEQNSALNSMVDSQEKSGIKERAEELSQRLFGMPIEIFSVLCEADKEGYARGVREAANIACCKRYPEIPCPEILKLLSQPEVEK